MYLSTRNFQGHTALFLQDAKNTITGQKAEVALAIMQDDGTWDVRLGDEAQWRSTGWHIVPKDGFVDSKGRMWVEDAMRRIDSDMKMRVMPPGGLEIRSIIGEDGAGRMYMQAGNGHVVIYSEHAERARCGA